MNAGPLPARIREGAATWRSRRDAGFSEQDAAEFAAWLQADERHAIAFSEIDATWNALARLGSAQQAGEADPDLLSPAPVLAFDGEVRRSVRSKWLLTAGSVAAAAIVGLLAWNHVSPASKSASPLREIQLADGSSVELNANSDVTVNFTAAERRIRLVRGEAHFVVAPNPERPFVVTVRDVTVRAVGTAFNVRWDSAVLEVLVTEGKVEVADGTKGQSLLPVAAGPVVHEETDSGDRLLLAGQRAVISMQDPEAAAVQVSSLAPEDVARALAWREARLEFVDVSLAQAVEMFNRRNRHQLRIMDPQLREQRFGGSFRADGYEAFVRLLESDFGVVAERRPDETILRKAR